MRLDILDKRILHELSVNCRLSTKQIAGRVEASNEKVAYRIKRLCEESYIKRFYTIFDTSKLGYMHFKIYIKLRGTTPEIERDLIKYIREQKNCINLRVLEGPYDMSFLNIVKSPGKLSDFISKLKGRYGEYIHEIILSVITHMYYVGKCPGVKGDKSKIISFSQKDLGDYEIDEIDKGVMRILSRHGRIKVTKAAKILRVDSKVVAYRIKKLENAGIIVSHTYEPNYHKFGLGFYKVGVYLKNFETLSDILSFFIATGNCNFAYLGVGKYNLTVELSVENNKALKNIIEEFKNKFVDKYHYYDVFQIFDEYVINWSPFDAE